MNKSRSGPPQEADQEDRSPPGGLSPGYVLRLYVTGGISSLRAIARVREICEELLPGRYRLQVIDIYQQPSLAGGDRITAAPTLVRRAPGPLRRSTGDLASRERILACLELQAAAGG